MIRFILLLIMSLIAFSQTVEVEREKVAKLIESAQNGKRASEQNKLLRTAITDAKMALLHADTTIAELELAYFDMEKAYEFQQKIIKYYEDRADLGNKLVFTSAVGIITYITFDGDKNEKLYVFGGMGATYLLVDFLGVPFDLFKLDLGWLAL